MGNTNFKPEKVKSVYFAEFESNLPTLEGKTVAITGCTTGTGFIAAKTTVKKNAKHLVMLNRSSERASKAEEAIKAVAKETGSSTKVETIACDLQDYDSIDAAITQITAKYDSLDVLCNNAGVMALDDYATKQGYDVQMQTNHLSHFRLTRGLFPLLQRAVKLRGEARIVNHSSGARHGGPLKAEYFGKNGGNLGGNASGYFFSGPKWERYQQTKLANSVWTAALKERLEGTGIKASVAAPGLAATNLQVTTGKTGGMDGMWWIMWMSQSAEDGTMPLLSACFDPSTNNGDFWEPGGWGNMSGKATLVKYDKNTADADQQKMLWEVSEEACGKFEIKK